MSTGKANKDYILFSLEEGKTLLSYAGFVDTIAERYKEEAYRGGEKLKLR